MAHYLVTGAAGFIGARVTRLLLEQGDEVTGVDNVNDAYDVRLKEWRLQELQAHAAFRFVKGDIADRVTVEGLFAAAGSYHAVLNLAARAGVRQSVENPWVYFEANQTGTLNLLDACVRSGTTKFVLASTSSLYGQDNPRPYGEDANTDRPLSPYAASKKAAETLAWTYHYLHGMDVSILRYFTVYGPAGRPDMSVFRFIQWIREGRTVRVFGDGRQERDFTFVEDVARATVAAVAPLGYEIINVGSDQPVVLIDAIRMIESFTGTPARLTFEPRHPADVTATWARVDKAKRLLDWSPAMPFREGLQQCVEWYESNRAWAAHVRTD